MGHIYRLEVRFAGMGIPIEIRVQIVGDIEIRSHSFPARALRAQLESRIGGKL